MKFKVLLQHELYSCGLFFHTLPSRHAKLCSPCIKVTANQYFYKTKVLIKKEKTHCTDIIRRLSVKWLPDIRKFFCYTLTGHQATVTKSLIKLWSLNVEKGKIPRIKRENCIPPVCHRSFYSSNQRLKWKLRCNVPVALSEKKIKDDKNHHCEKIMVFNGLQSETIWKCYHRCYLTSKLHTIWFTVILCRKDNPEEKSLRVLPKPNPK